MRDMFPLILVAAALTFVICLGGRPYTVEIDGHKFICHYRTMVHHPDCPCGR